jgi:PAS domain S-box-containing protein
MKDENKTKKVLVDELRSLRQRLAQLDGDLTEHERIAAVLRASEENYRAFIQYSTEAFCRYETEPIPISLSEDEIIELMYRHAHLIECNDAFARMFGKEKAGDLIGLRLADTLVRSDLRNVAFLRSFIRSGYRVQDLESFETDADGNLRCIANSVFGVIEDGCLTRTWGVRRDVTEVMQSAEALKKSEREKQTILDRLLETVIFTDTELRIIWPNKAACDSLGVGRDELIGRYCYELWGQRNDPCPDCVVIKAMLSRQTEQIEKVTPDGEAWFNTGHPVTDAAGEVIGGIEVCLNITERKQAEQAVRESETKFRTLVEGKPDAVTYIHALDENQTLVYISPQVEEILGYPGQELLRDPNLWTNCVHPDDIERVHALADRCGRTGEQFVAEYRVIGKDGREIWLHDVADLVRDIRGNPVSLLGIAINITDRKDVEEQLFKLNSLKEQLLGTKSLGEKLKSITEGAVGIFGADFSRIWISREGDVCDRGCLHAAAAEGVDVCRDRTRCLHLVASSGRYARIDGSHRRVPLGCYKIGRVASGEDPYFITNKVTDDPGVHDHSWAKNLGLVSFAGFRLLSADGRPLGVLALFRKTAIQPQEETLLQDLANTTSQVILAGTAEEARQEMEARFRTLFDQSPVGISIARNSVTLHLNKAALKIFGYEDGSELIGTSQLSRIAPHRRQTISENVTRRERGAPASNNYETVGLRKDGSTFPLQVQVACIHLADGPATVAFFTDVTDRKRTEEDLQKAHDELEDRVEKRTLELRLVNDQLQKEILEHERTQEALMRSEKQLRFLSSRLLEAQEEERKRIARELHDSIGQSLAAVKFNVENLLLGGMGRPEMETKPLQLVIPIIQGAIEEARRIYTGLRPSILDDLGILATVSWFCREFRKTFPHIRVGERVEVEEEDIPESIKIVIFRIIQEALNNAAKYSGAKWVNVALSKTGRSVELTIQDNGRGFDVQEVMSKNPGEKGIGLTGMRERTELSGGVFVVASIIGGGTRVRAWWPAETL